MEDVICVAERQEDNWFNSSTFIPKSAFWEFSDSMLNDYRLPSIPNENHQLTSVSRGMTRALGHALYFSEDLLLPTPHIYFSIDL